MKRVENKKVCFGILAVFVSACFFGSSAFAASDISVSNSGKVSFGKVGASSTGTLATGEDTLNIVTDCEAGANVYATSVNGGSTNLTNLAANSNNIITTSSNTIGSAGSLENNTWGLNTVNDNTFYGLPEYSVSGLPTALYSGTDTEIPVYYGAKVTNDLTPGTYTGEVLYTVTVNNSCLDYTVKFNKNANDASGDMSDQSILPTGGALSENSFTYSGYAFLGWSLDPAGKTGTAENGIGTAEDVDFADKASFPGSNEEILPGSETTLYAIWEKQTIYMQNWFGCAKMAEGETIILTDSRDGNEYTVKKFGSGSDAECWMISNLTLGYDQTNNVAKGYTLAKDDTNIPDNTTYYLPPAGKRGSVTSPSTVTATDAATFEYNNAVSEAHVQYAAASQTGSTNPQPTGYYNYPAATLGYSYFGGSSSGDTPRDICPAGWRLPYGSSTGDKSWYKFYNTFNGGTYANMVSDTGAMFSSSGFYRDSSLSRVDSYSVWWSSTIRDGDSSYSLDIDSSGAAVYPREGSNTKFNGFAVRCVAQYSDVSGYMQDFDTNDLAPGESATLLDKRDNQEYTVYRIPTDATYPGTSDTANVAGKVIMTKDLNLGAVASVSGSASTIIANGAMTLSVEDSNFTIPTGGGENVVIRSVATVNNNHNNWDSYNVYYTNKQYTAQGTGGYAGRGYYSWGAAMVACPAGWRLPTSDEYNNNDEWESSSIGISRLIRTGNAAQTTSNAMSLPWQFALNGSYNGAFNGSASNGGYWSSTMYDGESSYYLYLHSSAGFIRSRNYKFNGNAVRCIAKDSYIINYDANGGVGEMSSSRGYIGGGTTLPRNTFTKSGYYFAGWSTDPSATAPTYVDNAIISTDLTTSGNIVTLYAIWDKTNILLCSESIHPTAEDGCRMPDGKVWIYGNNGDTASWSNLFTNSTGGEMHDATLMSGKCPTGFSAPKKSDYDNLIAATGDDDQLYNLFLLNLTNEQERYFWSSTEYDNTYAGFLDVYNGWANTAGSNKPYRHYLLCYR